MTRAAAGIWLVLLGCNETGLIGGEENIAVSYGDFDDLTPALARLGAEGIPYDGLISNATWSEEEVEAENSVEDLLLDNRARLHRSVWLTSGTRGLGATVYNRNAPDDQLLQADSLETARAFVDSGRDLLCTDWAYDLIAQAWPDAIGFYGDRGVYDAAQQGDVGTVVARVTDARLAESLGSDQIVLSYNFSNWAVVTDVDPAATVWLRGDVWAWDGNAYTQLADVPLLVSFEPADRSGRVVYASFHGNAQPAALTDALLTTVLGPLPQAER